MTIQIFFRRVIPIALLFLSMLGSWAQSSADSDELAKMRRIYEAELAKRKIPVLKKLLADLSVLELKLTKANKLDEALLARTERLEIEAEFKRLGGKIAASKKVAAKPASKPEGKVRKEFTVTAKDASIQGSLKRQGGAITEWNTTTCTATWSGQNVVPGIYDVYLRFTSRYPGTRGTIHCTELRQEFDAEVPNSWKKNTTLKIGTFKLGTRLGFRIKSESKNKAGIMDLYSVTFKPVVGQ